MPYEILFKEDFQNCELSSVLSECWTVFDLYYVHALIHHVNLHIRSGMVSLQWSYCLYCYASEKNTSHSSTCSWHSSYLTKFESVASSLTIKWCWSWTERFIVKQKTLHTMELHGKCYVVFCNKCYKCCCKNSDMFCLAEVGKAMMNHLFYIL